MSNVYTMFQTNKSTEQDGVLVTYGDTRFRVARAGGSNQRFRKLLQAKMKPYRHQLDNETMDERVSEQLMREAFAEAVVLGWETRVEADDGTERWEPWLDSPDGQLEFSPANCVKVLTDLPDLFRDLQKLANNVSLFRKAEEEEDAKN